MKKIAAIDIGSNAVRILITYVISSGEELVFQKNLYLRLPLRLGEDSFRNGIISNKKIKRLSEAMISFKYIMKVHNVSEYGIYATSALRESKNSNHVISEVENSSGLKINLIDGLKEAKLIARGNPLKRLDYSKTYLYVDVGGGSTEYSILKKGNDKKSKSFKIGTVRLLNNPSNDSVINDIRDWLKSNIDSVDKVKLYATGGNINKIQSMSGIKQGKPLPYLSIKNLYNKLIKYDYHERVIRFDLNPDRADVIIPALQIFIFTMEFVSSNKLIIPKLGLVDGIIREIYYDKIFVKLDS